MSGLEAANTVGLARELRARAFVRPALESLNFSSNCTLVGNFYKAWFSELREDSENYDRNGTYNITYWVPTSLPADVIEEYFRAALPGDVRGQATYADILGWENDLRKNYSDAVEALRRQSQNGTVAAPMNASLFPYFDFAVERPGLVCKDKACSQGFEWALLPDINGPGATVTWFIQAGMITLFSAAVAWQWFSRNDLEDPPRKTLPWGLYELAKRSIRGLQEVAQVFIAALMMMIVLTVLNEAKLRKHLVILFYLDLFMTSLSIWLALLERCASRMDRRRQTHQKVPGRDYDVGEGPLSKRAPESTVKALIPVVFSHVISLVGLIAAGCTYATINDRTSQFEAFQNSLCGFRPSDNIQLGLFVICCIAAGLSFLSAVSPGLVADCMHGNDFTEMSRTRRLLSILTSSRCSSLWSSRGPF